MPTCIKLQSCLYLLPIKEEIKKRQHPYKPGSVRTDTFADGVCHLSNPHVTTRLQRSTLHRTTFGRTTLKRWYTRTCSPQMVQPADRPTAGGLLHHLLTLTMPCMAVIFFYQPLPLPTASIFGSGASYAARTFLPYPYGYRRQTGILLLDCKSTRKRRYDKINILQFDT